MHSFPATHEGTSAIHASPMHDQYPNSLHPPSFPPPPGIGTTSSAMADDGMLDIDVSVPLYEVWANMEALVAEGLVRSIGIR